MNLAVPTTMRSLGKAIEELAVRVEEYGNVVLITAF